MNKVKKYLSLFLVVNTLLMQVSFALNNNDIINVIKLSQVIPVNKQIQVKISNKEVVLSMYYSPKASDQDCKIDAVLLTRAIMQKFNKEVSLVRIFFYDNIKTDEYRMVVVRSGDIQSFGKGKLDEKLLFSVIDVIKGRITHSSTAPTLITNINMLVPGIRLEERQALLASILACRKHGGNINIAMKQFIKLEDAAKSNNEYLVDKYLNSTKREVDILTYQTQNKINTENNEAPIPSDASYNELAQVYSLITQVNDHGDKVDSQLMSTYNQLHQLAKSSSNAAQVAQGSKLLVNLLISRYKYLKSY